VGVKLKNKVIKPAVELDSLHVDQLVIKHQRKDDSPTMIEGYGAAYGKLDGKKYYDTTLVAINCSDMQSRVFAEGLKSGKSEQECYAEYMHTIAELGTKYSNGEITDWTLMVMFELAIGRIFEILSSKLEVENIN
jgi:hypothetical protein